MRIPVTIGYRYEYELLTSILTEIKNKVLIRTSHVVLHAKPYLVERTSNCNPSFILTTAYVTGKALQSQPATYTNQCTIVL